MLPIDEKDNYKQKKKMDRDWFIYFKACLWKGQHGKEPESLSENYEQKVKKRRYKRTVLKAIKSK
jgi:hypothetical protein